MVWVRLPPEFFFAVNDAVLPRHSIDTPPLPFLFACTPEMMPHLSARSIPVPAFPLALLAVIMLSPLVGKSIPPPPLPDEAELFTPLQQLVIKRPSAEFFWMLLFITKLSPPSISTPTPVLLNTALPTSVLLWLVIRIPPLPLPLVSMVAKLLPFESIKMPAPPLLLVRTKLSVLQHSLM